MYKGNVTHNKENQREGQVVLLVQTGSLVLHE